MGGGAGGTGPRLTCGPTAAGGRSLARDEKAGNGRSCNVAASEPESVNQVAESIGQIRGKDVKKDFAPPRAGDIRDSWADITAAREAFGWEPSVDLEVGLRRTVGSLVG